MKTATLTNNLNGKTVEVHATTDHSASSYGVPVWVDNDGQAYCQVGFESPFFSVNFTDEEKPIPSILKDAREAKGLTLRELSDLTGINASNLSRIERGEISPNLDTLQCVCSALGLKISLF